MTAAPQLPVSNIINISVALGNLGINAYNTSNLLLMTADAPNGTFPSAGYQIYLTPAGVATDFGTASTTYQMANAVFSQTPNILAGGGYLVVATYLAPTSGITATTNSTTSLTALSSTTGIEVGDSVTGTGIPAGTYVTAISGTTVTMSQAATASASGVSVTFTETLNSAIVRTNPLFQYFGVMSASILGQADLLAAAATVQAMNKILFAVGDTSADIATGGKLDLLRSGGLTQTRGLYYGDTSGSPAGINALLFQAAYAGRGLSVNFNGSNTALTMNLKTLNTIQPDPTMTQTLYTAASTAGADVYVSLQGTSCVVSFGANDYFDNQYNLQWLAGALQVAGFNYLASTSGKIPQTEDGMTGLKGAYRAVLEQGKTNGMIAPGSWTSATTFGDQAKFLSNIQNVGYYIYSQPVALQAQSARAARQAPVIQVALKYQGAVHSSSVIVNVNA
jgi:hypothetical protein